MFTPGDKLEYGHYTILRELGAGGMGVVYHCRDEFLQREIAIKMLLPELMADDDTVEIFRQEARLAAQLEHPNIVTIHNIGLENREGKVHHYIAMEYLPGGSLKGRLGKEPVSLEQSLEWMKQLATALSYAHRRGVVHQDIKPDNIFITQDQSLKIGDFGLALIATGVAFERAGAGTPAYMSPELCRGEPRDHRSDIYSLGAVFFEILTGQKPFKASGMIEMALKHATAPVPSAAKMRPDMPEPLDKILREMMAKEPDERTQNLGDILPDLEKLLLEQKVARLGMGGPTKSPTVAEMAGSAGSDLRPSGDGQGSEGARASVAALADKPEVREPRKAGPIKFLGLQWSFKTAGPIGWSAAPTLSRNRKRLFVSSSDGALYCLDTATGALIWHFRSAGAILSRPQLDGEKVFVSSADGNVYYLDANGQKIWKASVGEAIVASPMLAEDSLFVTDLGGGLKCLTLTDGAERWSFKAGAAVVCASPVQEGTVFVSSRDGNLYALTVDKGRNKWNFDTGGAVLMPALASSDSIYVASASGAVSSIDFETGRKLWTCVAPTAFISPGSLESTTINYCGEDNHLYCFDRYKGSISWKAQTAGRVLGGLSGLTGNLYVVTTGGVLQCFQAKQGEPLWESELKMRVDAPALVSAQAIYVGSVDGEVYAYNPPPKT